MPILEALIGTIPAVESDGVLGQVWYLIVSIPDLCLLSYFILVYTEFTKGNARLYKMYELEIMNWHRCNGGDLTTRKYKLNKSQSYFSLDEQIVSKNH